MPTNPLPLYGLLVTAVLCAAAAPWLRRLYRRRFEHAEPGAPALAPAVAPVACDREPGPFATPGQVCFAGAAVVIVALLRLVPIAGMSRGMPLWTLRLLDLGLMPFVSANSLVVMVAILVPWLRRRATSPRGLDRGTAAVYALTAGLMLYQTVVLTGHFEYYRPDLVPTACLSFLPAWLWLVAGAMLCLGLALAIKRVCGGHGFSLVLAAVCIAGSGPNLTGAISALRTEAGAPGFGLGAFLLPIVPLALFTLVTAGLLGERTIVLRQRDGQHTFRLPVPMALAGNMPLFLGSNWLYLMLDLLRPLLGQPAALNKHLQYGAPASMALQAASTVLFVYVYALIILPPSGFRERLARFGLVPVATRDGHEPERLAFSRRLWTLQWPWLAVLLLSAWTPQVLRGGLGVPAALASGFVPLVIPLAALTAAFMVQRNVRRRGWQPVFRHRELYEILTARALLAERGIPAEIVWQEAYGALTGMFVGPLAGKSLCVPGDRYVEAAGIVEEYQCGLKPDGGEPRAPDRAP
jgi:preprotein translocase subunit SecY